MILVDWQIAELCNPCWLLKLFGLKPLVEEFESMLLNPASLDLRIGATAKKMLPNGDWADVELCDTTDECPQWLCPGDKILVSSLETINLPPFLCAQFRLKSSRGREFYEHMEAGYCDPGWHGSKLTMEIINLSNKPLPVFYGQKIGQLVFALVLGVPLRSYAKTGRYNNDKTVKESKG